VTRQGLCWLEREHDHSCGIPANEGEPGPLLWPHSRRPASHVCGADIDRVQGACFSPTVQPSWVVQPDAVCEVGGLTPDLSYGDLGIFLGDDQIEKFVH